MNRVVIVLAVLLALFVAAVCGGCSHTQSWDTAGKGTAIKTPPIVATAFTLAASGNAASLQSLMTPRMASLLPPNSVRQLQAGLTSLGKVQAITTWRQPSQRGIRDYHFIVHCEWGDAEGFLAQDAGGKIAGLVFHPAKETGWDTPGAGRPIATPPVVNQAVAAAASGDFGNLKPHMIPKLAAVLATSRSVSMLKVYFHRFGPVRSISTDRRDVGFGVVDYHFTAHLTHHDVQGYLAQGDDGRIVGLRFIQPALSVKDIFEIAFSR